MSRSAAKAEQAAAPSSTKRSTWGWRRLLVIVFCLALGLAAGVAYYTKTPKTYQASATVLVLPTATGLDANSPGGSTDINMETEAELARSASVASRAADALEGELTTGALLKEGNVTVPVNSQVVFFSVLAPKPETAQDGANAWANAYLESRSERAADVLGVATETLQARYDSTQAKLDALPAAPSSRDVEANRDVLITKLSDINKQLIVLGVGSTVSGQIITEATLPTKAAAPQLPLAIGAGLLAGGALAVGLILLGALRRSRSTPHVEPTTQRSVPVLAAISGANSDSSGGDAADLRRTCREIAALATDPGPVALIGGGDPATATRVALQLGTAWAAEFGTSVVVSTDSTAQDALPVEVRDRPGVFDLLVNGVSPLDCATPLPNSRALIIGPGSRGNVSDEVSTQRLTQVWAQLDHELGTVLVSAIQHESPIGLMTIRTAGRVVGIVRADGGRDQDLEALLDVLDDLAASDRLVGVIVVDDGDLRTFQPGGAPMADDRPASDFGGAESGDVDRFDPNPDPSEGHGGAEDAGSVYDRLSSGLGRSK